MDDSHSYSADDDPQDLQGSSVARALQQQHQQKLLQSNMAKHAKQYLTKAIKDTYTSSLPYLTKKTMKSTISEIQEVEEFKYSESPDSRTSSHLFNQEVSKRELRYGPKHIRLRDNS
mmetsp:Transcript_5817/g.9297  ORF Transcript_5817/g.9297 Transcript_5817/m.9297 type:complete len:117 (+) Transcript_5817:32-382(+)